MNHKEYKQIVPGAEHAILFIHGILGTPDHFDDLISLVPDDISIHNLLLDGHGKTASDFSQTSMHQWEIQVEQAVADLLKTHARVSIVAHSMGTLFAIQQAIFTGEISGLFLLAVPIVVSPKLRMFSNAFKVYWGRNDRFGAAAKAACSISPSRNPFHYLGWIPRYLELFQKIHKTRTLLQDLHTPTIAIQSRLDEMVSENADRYLRKHTSMDVYTLEKSYHYLYDSQELIKLKELFQGFLP